METSTSAIESLAVLSIRLPSLLCALWTPGVSSRTYWSGPRVTTPVMRVRVVCGLEVTIATFSPDQTVRQTGLAHIGAADDRHKHGRGIVMLLHGCCVFQNRTPLLFYRYGLFRIADGAGQTQLRQDSFFLFPHPHGFQTAVFVVIAQKVKHGVDRQEGHFPLERMPVQGGLLLGALHADDDIAQHLAAVVLIHIVNAVFAQREAQDIGGHGLVAVLIVQLCNGGIVHEGDTDLGGVVEMLIFQHSVAGPANQDAESRRNLDRLLRICDQNFIGHKCPLLSFFAAGFSRTLHSAPGWMCSCFVCLDDLLHKAVTDDILFRKIALRDAIHIFQNLQSVHKAAAGPVRQIDLRHIAGHDDLGTDTHAGQEHLHLLRGGVLCLVQNDKGIVQRPAAHIGKRGHLDDLLFYQALIRLRTQHIKQAVVQRTQVRVDFLLQIAGQEAELFAGLHSRAGQDDAGDILCLEGLDRHGNCQIGLAGTRRADTERYGVFPDGVQILLLSQRLRTDRSALDGDRDKVLCQLPDPLLLAIVRKAQTIPDRLILQRRVVLDQKQHPSMARTAAETLAGSPVMRRTVPRQTAVTENSFSSKRMLRSQFPNTAAAISTLSSSILFSAMWPS